MTQSLKLAEEVQLPCSAQYFLLIIFGFCHPCYKPVNSQPTPQHTDPVGDEISNTDTKDELSESVELPNAWLAEIIKSVAHLYKL